MTYQRGDECILRGPQLARGIPVTVLRDSGTTAVVLSVLGGDTKEYWIKPEHLTPRSAEPEWVPAKGEGRWAPLREDGP